MERLGETMEDRAFLIASETDELCQPAHLLAALEETEEFAALRSAPGRPIYPRRVDPPPVYGGGIGYLGEQIRSAAFEFAERRGETCGVAHYVVALIDQADPRVVSLFAAAEVDVVRLRAAALDWLGAPADLPVLAMPALPPAGTADRPPLPVGELDLAAWDALAWRRDHLPLDRLQRRQDVESLSRLEWAAVFRVARQRGLSDDQAYSLLHYHDERVDRLVEAARPDLARLPPSWLVRRRRRGSVWERRAPAFMVGWPSWFGHRHVDAQYWVFKLRARSAYRNPPDARLSH